MPETTDSTAARTPAAFYECTDACTSSCAVCYGDHELAHAQQAAFERSRWSPERTEINRVALLMMDTWYRVDPRSSVTVHPASYVANFADMARTIIDDRVTTTTRARTQALHDAIAATASPAGATDDVQAALASARTAILALLQTDEQGHP